MNTQEYVRNERANIMPFGLWHKVDTERSEEGYLISRCGLLFAPEEKRSVNPDDGSGMCHTKVCQ